MTPETPALVVDSTLVSEDQAHSAMKSMGIQSSPQALQAYKTLGTWLVQNDVGATKLAQTFDSDTQIDFAVKISRELCESTDPQIRSSGVKSLLLAIKTRSTVAEQAIKLAQASATKNSTRQRNLPPIFNGPVNITVPEKQAISV